MTNKKIKMKIITLLLLVVFAAYGSANASFKKLGKKAFLEKKL